MSTNAISSEVPPSLQSLVSCFDLDTLKANQNAKILLVGAGGIGCEVLKNLVLVGFRSIDVIDLDTIDVSNLNRQFLFSRRDVGLSKSKCSKRSVLEFIPAKRREEVKINDFEANVKEERFGIRYFEKFDLVLNALDNVSARQHVNRICISAGIPLLDSGTTGFLGQVNVIMKGFSQCYDCVPKAEAKNKSYAICTIRNTPDKPVHCVVWAKEVLKLLFGDRNDSMLADLSETLDTNEEGADEEMLKEKHRRELEVRSIIMKASTLPANILSSKNKEIDEIVSFCKNLFDALFFTEIDLKLKLKDGYKGAKHKPKPMTFDSLGNFDKNVLERDSFEDQTTWSDGTSRDIFVAKITKIISTRTTEIGNITFDKDDGDVMDFVAALTNLRASVFNIEKKSRFELKGIAGNIIHAIATTNAIVAGLQTMEAIKIIRNKLKGKPILEDVRPTWVSREPTSSGCLLQPQKTLEKPNPSCYTCGNAQLRLAVDIEKFVLKDLINLVLKKEIGINVPSVVFGSSELYLEGEDLDEEELQFFKTNLDKTLGECPGGGVKDGSVLNVEDFSQEISFQILIQHMKKEDFDEEKHPHFFTLLGKESIAVKEAPQETELSESKNGSDTIKRSREKDNDDLIILDHPLKKKQKTDEIQEEKTLNAAEEFLIID